MNIFKKSHTTQETFASKLKFEWTMNKYLNVNYSKVKAANKIA